MSQDRRVRSRPPLESYRSIHLAIGPGGVFVIDSKQYRGRLQLDRSGRLWHGRYPLAPALRAVSFEADQAAQVLTDADVVVVVVVPIVAVHGA
jgi:Nuclease-related domain